MTSPSISVVMAVYNEEDHLGEAIQSILSQTFSDFEFIIIDDASTDRTVEILAHYADIDTRIKILRNQQTLRLPGSLNRGIEIAKGDWIARMDGDDISLPIRFEKQIGYLKTHPDISVLSTWITRISPDGKKLLDWTMPEEHSLILWRMLFSTPVYHGTALIKHSVFKNHGLFNPDAILEDLDLWARLADKVIFGCVPEPLYLYRDSSAARSEKAIERVPIANSIRREFLEDLIGEKISPEAYQGLRLSQVGKPEVMIGYREALGSIELLLRIRDAFIQKSMFLSSEQAVVQEYIANAINNIFRHYESEFPSGNLNYKYYQEIAFWRNSGAPRFLQWLLFFIAAPGKFIKAITEKLSKRSN